MGHIVSKDSTKANPAKISAIFNIPIRQNKKKLLNFLGMDNYLGKFVNNLSELKVPLRLLLVKNAEWFLQKSHLDAISNIKDILTKAPILHFYDPSRPIRVSVDANSRGLDAVLEQQDRNINWTPIAYASLSFTPAESRYA